ncbi:ParB/RepB/Spo0J family partition protein [Streptomyces pseudovenezuelae]|uniref:ParB/RepB/Spo0J family partition protein n=1 Tax=Streptomyces pseudovenezuelae TaxID=67350 RepID=UPI002E80D8F2|nr:ParB/RepB/Spo0J family partition protein [Streptomyces pseudovenezuelae]WUA94531.1 ParB/RepB/Spo0J family partition protein [Streptomyces pseudovenezuelae]
MAGKRVSLASLAGEKVEAVPGASRPDLIHVHPSTVAPTPLNPRRAFDDTELTELGEDMRSGQLQPCVAVAKAAYLKLYPEHAEQLPADCRYVMAAGERRWRAALKVGLASLDLMLRHDLTESRVRFLAAVLSENVQRANFNPIEEADGLRAMLDLHDGNQAAAARAMGKSKAWFNQRIGLLRLSDEMVQLVLDGKLTAFRDMRRYAALPPGEQYAVWKTDQEQPRRPDPSPAPVPEPEGLLVYTAVYPPPAAAPDPEATAEALEVRPEPSPGRPAPPAPAAHPVAAPVPAQTGRPDHVPERPQPVDDQAPAEEAAEQTIVTRKFPYDDGRAAAGFLIARMSPGEFDTMLSALLEHQAERADVGR